MTRSSRIATSLRLSADVATLTGLPGEAQGLSAVASSHSPVHERITSSNSPRLATTSGSSPSVARMPCALSSSGTIACGRSGRNSRELARSKRTFG